MCVLTSAVAASSLPASAEPALNPNQPNHRIPAPISVSGRLCGAIGCCGQPRRLPEHEDRGQRRDPGVDVHDRAAGEVERAALEQPARGREHPVRDRRVHEHEPETARTTSTPTNRIRSAIAPVISAGVMIANISWKARNASGGIVSANPVGDVVADVVHPREVEVADDVARAREGERVDRDGPQHAHDAEAERSSA